MPTRLLTGSRSPKRTCSSASSHVKCSRTPSSERLPGPTERKRPARARPALPLAVCFRLDDDSEGADLAVDRCPRDTQPAGRLDLVAVGLPERADDRIALHGLPRG